MLSLWVWLMVNRTAAALFWQTIIFFYLFKITSRLTGCRNQRDSIQAGQQFQFFNSLPVIPSRTIKQKINYLSVAGSTMNCNSSSHHAEEGVCEAGYKNKKILFFIKKPVIGGKLKGRCPFPGLGSRIVLGNQFGGPILKVRRESGFCSSKPP